jgi:tetratricopeptide (TPR) repeat protein
MHHDVESEPLPFFLREVDLKKLSGHLFVTAKDFQISLNFMGGKLANGMSTRFDEKLSVILHLMGRIDEEQYNFLSGLHQFSDDQVAGILLDHNFAKKKDIYYARVYQLRRIAISTFSLQRGKWIFTAGEPDPPLRETFEIPLAGILVEGARAVDHISVYANKWQQSVPVLFSEIPMADEIYFTAGERDFYAAVQRLGPHSCQELIARLNMLPLDFWRAILAFHLLGIIEFEKRETAPDLEEEIAALLRMHRQLQEAPAGDSGVLGLPPPAAPKAVARAVSELLARFAPERFGSAAAPEIKKIARDVCLLLRELAARLEAEAELPAEPELLSAEELISEPTAEPELLSAEEFISEPPAEPELLSEKELISEPAAPAQPQDEFELSAEFAVEAEPPAGPAIYFEAPDMDAQAEAPDAEPRFETEVTFEAEEEPELPAAPEVAAPQLFTQPVPPPSLHMANADHEKAWELLLQSKELYEKHECAKAVPLLKKAIKLNPGQGDFYHLLGVCQSEEEVWKNEAEINLKKAVELKSWSADPVYALGVLYRGQGKMKLAERCFQRVKEIAYEHTGASRQLVDLRRRRSGDKVKTPLLKKKIF